MYVTVPQKWIIDNHKTFFLSFLIDSWSRIIDFQWHTSISFKERESEVAMNTVSSWYYDIQNKTQKSLLGFQLLYKDRLNSWRLLSWSWLELSFSTWSFFDIIKIESNISQNPLFNQKNMSWIIAKFQSKNLSPEKKSYLGKPFMFVYDIGRIIWTLSWNRALSSWLLFEDTQRTFVLGLSFLTWSLIVYDKEWISQENMTRNTKTKEISYIFLNKTSDESITISWKINTIRKNNSSIRLFFEWVLLYDVLGVSHSKNKQWILYNINSELLYKPIQ